MADEGGSGACESLVRSSNSSNPAYAGASATRGAQLHARIVSFVETIGTATSRCEALEAYSAENPPFFATRR